MKKPLTLTLLLLLFLLWLPVVKAKPFTPAQPVVFTHVTVIDTVQGKLYSDSTVVIQGNLITALGKTGRVPVPTLRGTRAFFSDCGRSFRRRSEDFRTHLRREYRLFDRRSDATAGAG
jgi:hypothetical protein